MSQAKRPSAPHVCSLFPGEAGLSWPVFHKEVESTHPDLCEKLRSDVSQLTMLFSCTATGEEAVDIRKLLVSSMRGFLERLQPLVDIAGAGRMEDMPVLAELVQEHRGLREAIADIDPNDAPRSMDYEWRTDVLLVLQRIQQTLEELFPPLYRPGVMYPIRLAMRECTAVGRRGNASVDRCCGHGIRVLLLEIINYFQNFQTFSPHEEKSEDERTAMLRDAIERIRQRLVDVFRTRRTLATMLVAARRAVLAPDVPLELRAYILEKVGGPDFPVVRDAVGPLRAGGPLIDQDRIVLAKRLEKPFREKPSESVEDIRFVPWEEIPFPEGVKIVRPPEGVQIGYKGGIARVALKTRLRVSLRGELPPADRDMIAVEKPDVWELAEKLGVDPDGVELVEDWDIGTYLGTRDVDLNEVLLTRDGLFYTDRAEQACRTGIIRPGRGRTESLYGTDCFYVGGKRFMNNRGLWRLLKFVAEEKADAFAIPKYNLQVGLGIYWLVLCRKFFRKENAGELLERVFHLGREMGTIPKHFHDRGVMSFLDWMHANCPFFDFEKELTEEQTADWLLNDRCLGFLAKQARQFLGVRTDFSDIRRTPGDEEEVVIDMEGFVPPSAEEHISPEHIAAFLERCRQRNQCFADFKSAVGK